MPRFCQPCDMAHAVGQDEKAADMWLAGYLAGIVKAAVAAGPDGGAGTVAGAGGAGGAGGELVCCPRHTAMAKALFPQYLAEAQNGAPRLRGLVLQNDGDPS